MLKTLRPCSSRKIYQTHDSSRSAAIPKAPLRVIDLSQCIASESANGKAVYALRELQKSGELHRDMEPIALTASNDRYAQKQTVGLTIAIQDVPGNNLEIFVPAVGADS